MPADRLRPVFPLLCAALVLGLSGCKQSADATAPAQEAGASATDKVAAVADVVNPLASPREEVIAAMRKFMAVERFHASMATGSGADRSASEMEFVAPDRFRMRMPGMPEQLVIGNTMYMTVEGRSMPVTLPAGTAAKWRNPANFSEAEATMTAESLGTDQVDGVLARKYLVHQRAPTPVDTTLWIGSDGLPMKLEATGNMDGKPFLTSIRYSRYNDPTIRIEPPK